jgi:hypothetical protein
LNLAQPGTAEIAIYDLTGKKILEIHHGRLAAGTHMLRIDGNRLIAGTYLVSCQTESGIFRQKLVKIY